MHVPENDIKWMKEMVKNIDVNQPMSSYSNSFRGSTIGSGLKKKPDKSPKWAENE